MLAAVPAMSQTSPAPPTKDKAMTPLRAYVGTFTTEQRKARGEGISVYQVDPATGTFTHKQTLGDQMNPSYLAVSRDQRFLYAVHGDGDYATSYAIDPETGQIRQLNRGATGGKNGV